MHRSAYTLIRPRETLPLTPCGSLCTVCQRNSLRIPLAWVWRPPPHPDTPTAGSYPSSTSGRWGKHNGRTKATLRSMSDVVNVHSRECDMEYAKCEYHPNTRDSSNGTHFPHTYARRTLAAAVSTCCKPHNERIVHGLRRGRFRTHHSDTDYGPRRQIDCTPGKCTVRIVRHTFHTRPAHAAGCHTRYRSAPSRFFG